MVAMNPKESEAPMQFEFRESSLRNVRADLPDECIHPHIANGRVRIWECLQGTAVVGHCAADFQTGEIVGLSVLPAHRAKGIGTKLLSIVVDQLHSASVTRIWLSAPADPELPAYNFYRALGWEPTGELAPGRSEILELHQVQ
jgi:ribosomal protein S18 acetylase RimI-like enzyme